tara:strand:+ start:699 stop:860 length:162 start_codon:yes stop_codon:yes gene_type:complete
MKKFEIIGRYPIVFTVLIGISIFTLGPIIFAIVIAGIIVLPIYLAVQMKNDKE